MGEARTSSPRALLPDRDARLRVTLAVGIPSLIALIGAILFALRPVDPEGPPLEVKWAGCAEVRVESEAPVCYVTSTSTLTLLLFGDDHALGEVTFEPGGIRLETAKHRSLPTGTRFRVSPPREDGVLRVSSRDPSQPSFELELRRWDVPLILRRSELEGKDAAELARAERDLEVYLNPTTDSAPRVEGLGPRALRVKALGIRARIQARRGDLDAAEASLDEAIQEHRELPLVSDHHHDRFMKYFLRLRARGKLGEERRWLHHLEGLAPLFPYGAALLLYYRAVGHVENGSSYLALQLGSQAMRALEELDREEAVDARFNLVSVQLGLGRYADARRLLNPLRGLDFRAERSCVGIARLLNLGFYRLLLAKARRARGPELDRSARLIEQAMRLVESKCPNDPHALEVYLTAASAHLDLGQLDRAEQALRAARPLIQGRPAVLPRLRHLQAWLLERRGELDQADEVYRAAVTLAEALGPDYLRFGLLGRARVARRSGRIASSLDLLTEAERVLDDQVAALPLGLGRETFLADNEEIAALAVDILLALGRTQAALDVVLRGHRRALVAIGLGGSVQQMTRAERARWQIALERYRAVRSEAERWYAGQPEAAATNGSTRRRVEADRGAWRDKLRQSLNAALTCLSPPPSRPRPQLRDDTGLLAFHPLTEGGWAAFYQTDRELHVARVAEAPGFDASVATTLVKDLPVTARVRLWVLDSAAAQSIDLGGLEAKGRPLRQIMAIAHVIDLPARPTGSESPRALVVQADPDRNLQFDEEEVAAVTTALEARGFDVSTLTGVEATYDALIEQLVDPTYALVHFIGHGMSLGLDGWLSGILLADGRQLMVADILTLESVPAQVVLSACSTGVAGTGHVAAGLGIAQAFLLRGAREVVGSTRAVQDRVAFEFSKALYRDGADLGAGFALAARATGAKSSSYRLWSRL